MVRSQVESARLGHDPGTELIRYKKLGPDLEGTSSYSNTSNSFFINHYFVNISGTVERSSSKVEGTSSFSNPSNSFVINNYFLNISGTVERGSSAVECWTHNRGSPGSKPLCCCRFEAGAFSFTLRHPSSLGCK